MVRFSYHLALQKYPGLQICGVYSVKRSVFRTHKAALIINTIYTSEGPFKMWYLRCLLVDEPMNGVLLSGSLLMSMGFNHGEHLAQIGSKLNEKDFSDICFQSKCLENQSDYGKLVKIMTDRINEDKSENMDDSTTFDNAKLSNTSGSLPCSAEYHYIYKSNGNVTLEWVLMVGISTQGHRSALWTQKSNFMLVHLFRNVLILYVRRFVKMWKRNL